MGQDETQHAEETLKLRSPSLDWLEVDDEVVVLDTVRSVYLGANATGAILWRELAKGTSRPALVDLLLESFDIERAQAERDVDSFVASVREQGLLEQQ